MTKPDFPKKYVCPADRSHAKPLEYEGKWYCGSCWAKDGRLVELRPCEPDSEQ